MGCKWSQFHRSPAPYIISSRMLVVAATMILDKTGMTNPNFESYKGMLVFFGQKMMISEMYNLDHYNKIM